MKEFASFLSARVLSLQEVYRTSAASSVLSPNGPSERVAWTRDVESRCRMTGGAFYATGYNLVV